MKMFCSFGSSYLTALNLRKPVSKTEAASEMAAKEWNCDSKKFECELLADSEAFPVDHPVFSGRMRLAEKLFQIMSDPFSRNFFERHDHFMTEFLDFFQDGFLLRDMLYIINILATLFERYDEHPNYKTHIKSILTISGDTKLRIEGRSDEIEFMSTTANFLSVLGYFLISEPVFKGQIIETLLASSNIGKKQKLPRRERFPDGTPADLLKDVSEAFTVITFEDSTLCQSLIQTLKEDNQFDYAYVIDVIIILNNLAEMSTKCCTKILNHNGPEVTCQLMISIPDCDLCTRIRFWALELFWILMKNIPYETSKALAAEECVKSLRDGFFSSLTQGGGKRIKQLRNDYLLLFLLIIQNSHNKNVLPPLFVKELSILASTPDAWHSYPLFANLKFEESWEDYELQEFLLCILKSICGWTDYMAFLNPKSLIQSLLIHLHPLSGTEKASPFVQQKKTLQTLALQILSYYAPEFLRIFLNFNGQFLIIQQILWCFSEDVLTERRFLHERDVYMRFCLKILERVSAIRDTEVINSLVHLNTVEHMLKIVKDTFDLPYEAPYIDYVTNIQSLAYLILSWLCDPGGEQPKVTIGSAGEDILIKYLKQVNTKEHCALPGHNVLLTSILNCVRCSVIGVKEIESSFKLKNGISYLIDLLLTSHPAVQGLILACLADLCSSTNTASHILKWRGPNKITLPILLCRLWREEEDRMGIKRELISPSKTSHYAVKNYVGTGKLLVGKHQAEVVGEPLPSSKMTAAVLDATENYRVQIYGLIEFMKEHGGSEAEPPKELSRLPLEDMATLAVIEGYLDLKGGEIWSELLEELAVDNFNPLPLENEFIYSVSRLISSRVGVIMGFQRQCTHLIQDKERTEFKNNYEQFFNWKSQEKLLVKKTFQYLAKTSNAETLRLSKEKEELELKLEQHKTAIKRLEKMKPERDVKTYNSKYN